MRVTWPVFILCVPFVVASCDSKRPSPAAIRGERRAEQVATESEPRELTREILGEQLEVLTRQLPGNTSVLMLECSPGGARLQAESPAARGSVRQYEWRSKELGAGVPVELRGKGQLNQNLFPLSTLELSALPGLLENARTRIDADQGRVARILVRRNLPYDESVGVRVYVDSPRRSGHIDADAHGRVIEAGRYP